ncbi:cupin domain-containing protein [Halobacteria archaeon HArc-gm2]|nr:cupin domain-containing protein [Halobacteria archaeon HArc-gm2]
MKTVAIDRIEPADVGSDAEKQSLGEGLGTSDIAINRYRVEPGTRLAGLHAHADQEEIFVVLDGTLTFETLDGEVTVAAGEAIRFEPGEHQSGKNDADGDAVVLALGAPRDTSELLIPVACADCGHDEQRLVGTGTGGALVCTDCGTESRPRCPECDGQDLHSVLGEDGETPVSKCKTCGTEWK